MRTVNIYALTRNVSNDVLPLYEKCSSLRDDELRIREGELQVINTLVNNFKFHKAPLYCYENWFYSFTIPQISKEFDLIKLGKNKIAVNIEIKEQDVDESKVLQQLIQNQHYLQNVAETVYCFSCVRRSDMIVEYLMLSEGELKLISIEDIINVLKPLEEAVESNIEDFFRPRDYLISPINTPKRFFDGKYFLTNHQEEIKKKIIAGLSEDKKLWGIKGAAGTGKTLLLYDIARSLAEQYRVCIIHSGILSEGHIELNYLFANVQILGAKEADSETLSKYEIVCVDETQRLYQSTLLNIIELLKYNVIQGCVFSYDYAQCLSKTEQSYNNPKVLSEIDGFIEEHLTEKIRTNVVMTSFIRNLLRLKDYAKKPYKYDCIDIVYANGFLEADTLLDIYKEKGYKFITLTPSQYKDNGIDHYAYNVNSHHVIGQEFDDVVIILDDNFRYSEEGELQAREHPNPNYLFPKLFYQNITRARERLCIIVRDNPDMFEKLLKIKDNIRM